MNSIEHGLGMGMGVGGWIIPLLVIILIFYLFQDKKNDALSAQDILDRRYANGEIDEKEYLKRSKDLKEKL